MPSPSLKSTPEALHARLVPLVNCPLAFYLNADGFPCATLEQGATPHRVVILSMPKAGTYFLAELVRQWGCVATNLHLSNDATWDYRQRTLQEIQSDSFRYQIEIPLSQSVSLIQAGQFAVGHLECWPEIRSTLAGFRKVFIYRDLRDALISQMRFLVNSPSTSATIGPWKHLPAGPVRMAGFLRDTKSTTYMFDLFRDMRAWMAEPDVFTLSFEQLYGDGSGRNDCLAALHRFLDLPETPERPVEAADRLVGTSTRTWSGERSSRDAYWDPMVERLFEELGGPELNSAYGYSAVVRR